MVIFHETNKLGSERAKINLFV